MGGEPGADRELDRITVEYRQHAGHPYAHRAHVMVGRRAECGRASAEELRARQELSVDLEPDYRFVCVISHWRLSPPCGPVATVGSVRHSLVCHSRTRLPRAESRSFWSAWHKAGVARPRRTRGN